MRAMPIGRTGVTAQPLYAQVRDRLLERIIRKEWQFGQVLPNEFDLARQFGVSIGTIRKAVEGLEAARIVTRKQGRGTFVSRESAVATTEPFSNYGGLTPDGQDVKAETLLNRVRTVLPAEIRPLGLVETQAVIEITRRRIFGTHARVLDRIAVPRHIFFDFDPEDELPCNLYEYFGDYFGVRVARSTEKLSIALASGDIAEALDVPLGTALMRVERISAASSGEPIEWRESFGFLAKSSCLSGPT